MLNEEDGEEKVVAFPQANQPTYQPATEICA